jgi:hypothetical protein
LIMISLVSGALLTTAPMHAHLRAALRCKVDYPDIIKRSHAGFLATQKPYYRGSATLPNMTEGGKGVIVVTTLLS